MSVYQIFVISRAGSLIYDYESRPDTPDIERRLEYPLSVVLEEVDQKAVVVFGEKDGIRPRFFVSAVNGNSVTGTRFKIDQKEENVLDFLQLKQNFPVNLTFSAPMITTNEKIILSSMFHSLYTIAVQLSPVEKSSGIEILETTQFRLSCLQSRTGVKFVVVTASGSAAPVDTILRELYKLYADFALKSPFYAIDMPIRLTMVGTHNARSMVLGMKRKKYLFAKAKEFEHPVANPMEAPNFPFLAKIPDQKGWIVACDGAVIKSDGDLANRENILVTVEKMASAQIDALPGSKFYNMNIIFGDYFLTVSRSGKYTFIVKRAISS